MNYLKFPAEHPEFALDDMSDVRTTHQVERDNNMTLSELTEFDEGNDEVCFVAVEEAGNL